MASTPALDRVRQQIRRLLDAKGAKQGELATYLGRSSGWMSMLMAGKRTMQFDVLDRVAAFFDVPVSALLADPEEIELPLPHPAESEGSHVAASRRRSERFDLERLVASQHASITRYQNLYANEQANRAAAQRECAKLQTTLELAESHLHTLLEHFKSAKRSSRALPRDAPAQADPAASVRARRTGRR